MLSPKADIVSATDTKLGQLFDLRMQLAEQAFADAQSLTSAAWWALHECHADHSWRTRFDNIDDWLGDLKVHLSISRGNFFETMNLIHNLNALGVDEEGIKKALGKPMTALKVDLPKLMKSGKLTEDAAQRVDKDYGSTEVFVEAVTNADPGTARSLVRKIVEHDQIFLVDEPVYSEYAGTILANLRWDNETGLVGVYTVEIRVTNITTGTVIKNKRYLPRTLAGWLLDKLGMKLKEKS